MKLYCGVDPSLRGFCSSYFSELEIMDFCFIRTNKVNNVTPRILIISSIFDDFIKSNKIKNANIEIPYFNRRNIKTYAEQMRLYQQILYVLESNSVIYNEYTPTHVKKSLGYGEYTKDEMRSILLKRKPKFLSNLNLSAFSEDELEGLFDSFVIGMT